MPVKETVVNVSPVCRLFDLLQPGAFCTRWIKHVICQSAEPLPQAATGGAVNDRSVSTEQQSGGDTWDVVGRTQLVCGQTGVGGHVAACLCLSVLMCSCGCVTCVRWLQDSRVITARKFLSDNALQSVIWAVNGRLVRARARRLFGRRRYYVRK